MSTVKMVSDLILQRQWDKIGAELALLPWLCGVLPSSSLKAKSRWRAGQRQQAPRVLGHQHLPSRLSLVLRWFLILCILGEHRCGSVCSVGSPSGLVCGRFLAQLAAHP